MHQSMASISGLLVYAMVMRFCSVCQARVLDLSKLSAACSTDWGSKISNSGCVFEVFGELIDELVAPICSRGTEVQMTYCFELNAFRAGGIRSAVRVLSSANRQPVMTEFDNTGADPIRECRDRIKGVGVLTVALLDKA
jgi:hypothetical protein